jgi:hypothetical protein
MERNANARRGQRSRKKADSTNRITLAQLCASVAYHYHLTPQQVAQFSGQQLLLWHERAAVEQGFEKLLDLQVSLVPHTEHPNESLREIREQIVKMTQSYNGR